MILCILECITVSGLLKAYAKERQIYKCHWYKLHLIAFGAQMETIIVVRHEDNRQIQKILFKAKSIKFHSHD